MVRRLRRGALIVGAIQTSHRFLTWVGVMLLTAWSYSLWGNELTPLRHLLAPALITLALALTLRVTLFVFMRWLRRALRISIRRRRVRKKVRQVRASMESVGKLDG